MPGRWGVVTWGRGANAEKKPAVPRSEGRAFLTQEKKKCKDGNGCGLFRSRKQSGVADVGEQG